MTQHIPVLGVLLATASAFVVGGIWYTPGTFLPRWQKITGTTDEHMKANFGKGMIWNGLTALVTSYFLAYFVLHTDIAYSGVARGLVVALMAWLGFVLTTIVSGIALDKRDKFLVVIQGGERLVTLLLMGIIIGAFI